MKADRLGLQPLAGPRAVAVLFDKPSTRTRVSFSVGVAELGGYPLVIDAATSQLGRGEPIDDTARVLDRQGSADRLGGVGPGPPRGPAPAPHRAPGHPPPPPVP